MTAEDAPRLIWTEDGSPRSGRFGDIYFSREDGLAESRAVFLQGCGLPDAWRGRRRFVVGELGFGTGLNIVALLQLWRRCRPDGGRLHIFSVEAFPLGRDEAARALSAWPELDEEASALLSRWPDSAPGFHRLDLPWNAVLDLAVGDAAWALEAWSGQADAWFLDGFAPSVNPGMWSDAVLDGVRARSAPGCRLATFTVAGAVRRGLAERGYEVEKRPGHGRKRERLEARLPGVASEPPSPRVAVIGGGIAGASLARAFAAEGLQPEVLVAGPAGDGGSGFPAALVTPRLDAGDDAVAGLFAQALARAGALYGSVEDAVLSRGVLQLEGAPRDAGRFDKIAAQPIWAGGAMSRVESAEASRLSGERVDVGGLWMAEALVARPRALLDAWLPKPTLGRVARIEAAAGAWRALGAEDEILAEAEIMVLACAMGGWSLLPDLPLSPVAGQADWVEGVGGPAAAWGGYAAPTGQGLLFGATHERGVIDPSPNDGASERNRTTLRARLPRLAERLNALPSLRRAAVRATTPDRLPLAGAIPGAPGLHILTGLGSRGFCAAPLLAEHVAAGALGAPSPLPTAFAARVDPGRIPTLGNRNGSPPL